MDKTKIQWTQGDDGSPGATWNPFRGCRRVSPGCQNCYAEAIAARFSKPGLPYYGFAKMTPSGPRWTGKVELVGKKLEEPLHWKRPRRIFVNSMSDLFYEEAGVDMIQAVVDVMLTAKQHTYIVLTKRAERLSQILRYLRTPGGMKWEDNPPAHVWVGVSVENQEAADERIPHLLRTPVAVRFLSVEPLLGPVNLTTYLRPKLPCDRDRAQLAMGISWCIIGGESGSGARPMEVEWARSVVRECREAGVAVFVKQLGAWPVIADPPRSGLQRARWPEMEWPEGTRFGCSASLPSELNGRVVLLKDKKGGDPEEWPLEFRVREFPRLKTVAEFPEKEGRGVPAR